MSGNTSSIPRPKTSNRSLAADVLVREELKTKGDRKEDDDDDEGYSGVSVPFIELGDG